ncbi:MAG: RdgB/HAM1 family non-canonical purine NTP pyrophosphatase [Clostridiales bacterium]|nr:RdgB/HAM1 family non-canonical purine NTP pyrophosphatase [Clostridiales bacterium]
MRLLVASHNEGKIREIRRLLCDPARVGVDTGEEWEILSLADLASLWKSETLGGLPPVGAADEAGGDVDALIKERYVLLSERMEETGSTFEENARIKAQGAAGFTGLLSLADDSGLEVDYLGGAPGVYSARYAGPEGDEQACNDLLLSNMREAPADQRRARYKVVIALAIQDRVLHVTTGECEGAIGFAPRGEGGFGYDPLFVLPGGEQTMADLSMEEKNKISHRGKALEAMKDFLADFLADLTKRGVRW